MRILILLFLLATFESFCQSADNRFLVCGGSLVHLVDYNKSRDTVPHIVWTWDANQAMDLPEDVRKTKFRSMDDCKPINGGTDILVSSSSGAVAVVNVQSKKVLFHALVPNAHSVEVLPGNLLAAAASTAPEGNKLMVFDLKGSQEPVFTDSLYSAHGVVWDPKRKVLFALGYDVLRAYRLGKGGALHLKREWKIPGKSGHDLQPSPDGKRLFVTEHTGAWVFDLASNTFKKIPDFPDAENIKSIGQNRSNQYIFTVPEESWWTFHVTFSNPERKFAFPGMKVYKARWFGN